MDRRRLQEVREAQRLLRHRSHHSPRARRCSSWIPPHAERNILGVIHKVGLEIGGKVIQARKYGHTVIEMIGGRKVHPCTSIPGGLTKGITEEQRQEIEKMGRWAVDFAQFSLKLFDDIVLKHSDYLNMILDDAFTHRTYYMGMVDEFNHVNFYDGQISIVDRMATYQQYIPREYPDWIAERRALDLPQVPYLKKIGWKGLVDGKDSGVYCATPLSRLNAADGMATPLASRKYERLCDVLAGRVRPL
jgi:F420-non-reducing hydrogenase large subunit